jgi:hypothetical protein
VDTLRDFLDQMWAITVASERDLRETGPQSAPELGARRLRMAHLLTSYQLFVHREVFEPMIRSESEVDRKRACEMKVECIVLAEEFRAFARLWATADLVKRWADYQPAGLEFLDRIRAHIARVMRHTPPQLFQPPQSAAKPIGRHVA